jgi:GTP-binding protein Era
MVAAAWQGAEDADVVGLMVDAERGIGQETRAIIERLKESRAPRYLILNKIDLVPREALLALTADLNALLAFEQTFMVSALKQDGIADVLAACAARLPAGPFLYPEDQAADLPLRLLAAEVTREQVFLQLHQELPYEAAVETEKWEERKDGSVRIEQTIHVQRDGQRAIFLGKGGARIKQIGARARHELGQMLERPVHLFLHVKVSERWAEDPSHYRAIGLDYDPKS